MRTERLTPDSLHDWLACQESLRSANSIELGLERCGRVARALLPADLPFPIVTVAGTNGKGSCVAMADSILREAGYRVGAYTSPHLFRYNERIRVGGVDVDDATLADAFGAVEAARGDTHLTYFELGTLAAMHVFLGSDLDVVLLEVGLGGRLDAVNLFAPKVALVTNVGVDHVEWLGPDRETIAREKAGIFRRGVPAVYGETLPPHTLVEQARSVRAPLYCLGRDFDYSVDSTGWRWRHAGARVSGLPGLALRGAFQYRNASAVLMVLRLLAGILPVEDCHVRRGLEAAGLPGRMHSLHGAVATIVDVAHNAHAAHALAGALREAPVTGRTLAVVGVLKDKDVRGMVAALAEVVDRWYLGALPGDRGATGEELAVHLAGNTAVAAHPSVEAAYDAAAADALTCDRIVVFGSFLTAERVLRLESMSQSPDT